MKAWDASRRKPCRLYVSRNRPEGSAVCIAQAEGLGNTGTKCELGPKVRPFARHRWQDKRPGLWPFHVVHRPGSQAFSLGYVNGWAVGPGYSAF